MNATRTMPAVVAGGKPQAPPAMSTMLGLWIGMEYQEKRGVEIGPNEWLQISAEPLTQALRTEALAIQPQYAAAALLAPQAVISGWLGRILLAVRNPPSSENVRDVLDVMVFALADFPTGCFTDKTLRRALQQFKFWPAAADIAELLGDDRRDIQRAARVLAYLANT